MFDSSERWGYPAADLDPRHAGTPDMDMPDMDMPDLDTPDVVVPEPEELDRWLPRDVEDGSHVAGVNGVGSVGWSGWAAVAVEDAALVLRGVSVDALGVDAAVELAVVAQRVIGWASAMQYRALARVGAQDRSAERWYQDVVACALRVPARAAQRRLAMAATLTSDLPDTLSALARGVISPQHAEAIGELAWTLPTAQHAHRVEQAVLGHAAEQTVPELRRALGRAAISTDPAAAQRRQAHARAARHVRRIPAGDGMSELRAYLPAPDAAALFTRLDAATRLLPHQDRRTRDQQRADLLTDAVLTGLPLNALPTHHGRAPTIHVTVAASTLLALNDEPAHLSGYGPITADTARAIAHDPSGTWRRLLTDPDTGALLDYGRSTYRPPRPLSDFIHARDQVCTYPGCQQPGYRCEIDHQKPFDDNGHTNRANTALGCKRHHQGKTRKIWDYRINADDSHTWTLPGGRSYTSHPPHTTHHPRQPDHPDHPDRTAQPPDPRNNPPDTAQDSPPRDSPRHDSDQYLSERPNHRPRTDPPPTEATGSSRFTLRPGPSDDEIRATQDATHTQQISELRLRKRHARSTARRTGDPSPLHQADRELRAQHTQHERLLRNRADPTYPPF